MAGFKLTYGGRTLAAEFNKNRVMTIIAGVHNRQAYINFGALDQSGEQYESLSWLDRDLYPDDELEILICDDIQDSEPEHRRKFIPGQCGIVTDEQKIKYFRTIEKKLMEKGAIPQDE